MTERGRRTRDELLTALLAGATLGAATGGPLGAMVGALAGAGLGAAAIRKRTEDVLDAGHQNEPVEESPRLKDLAASADVSPATAYAHLKRLEAERKVVRLEGPEGPAYAPRYYFQAEFIDPFGGALDRWSTNHPIDWRFPLVSRVPDDAAADFLYEWLDRAAARGLLPPLQSRHEPHDDSLVLRILVYGSCARGDARKDSDVDILLDAPSEWEGAAALQDLAHEVGLTAERAPDIRVWTEEMEDGFLDNLLREGRTVWTNVADKAFLEHLGSKA